VFSSCPILCSAFLLVLLSLSLVSFLVSPIPRVFIVFRIDMEAFGVMFFSQALSAGLGRGLAVGSIRYPRWIIVFTYEA